MKTRVEEISEAESAEVAFERMRQRRIRHLVVTRGKEVVGIVSDRDLAGAGSFRRIELVADVMTSPAVTANPHMTLRQTANLLRGRSIGCVPVIDDGKLVGILTSTDVLELVGRGVEHPTSKGKRWVMKGRGPRRKSVIGHKNVVAH
jgi:acetoin utilization protein AcuB